MSYQYDLVVIGCGPAGEKGAARAAYHGKKVAIVERADLGGVKPNPDASTHLTTEHPFGILSPDGRRSPRIRPLTR